MFPVFSRYSAQYGLTSNDTDVGWSNFRQSQLGVEFGDLLGLLLGPEGSLVCSSIPLLDDRYLTGKPISYVNSSVFSKQHSGNSGNSGNKRNAGYKAFLSRQREQLRGQRFLKAASFGLYKRSDGDADSVSQRETYACRRNNDVSDEGEACQTWKKFTQK